MGLIDDILDQGMDVENDPHPQEGVFFAKEDADTGSFLRVEEEKKEQEVEVPKLDDDGEVIMGPDDEPVMVKKTMPVATGRHMLVKYDDITKREARDCIFPEGVPITFDNWEGCVYFYEKQMLVLKGEMTAEEFLEEIEKREQTGEEPEIDEFATANQTYHCNQCSEDFEQSELEPGNLCPDCLVPVNAPSVQSVIDNQDDDDDDDSSTSAPKAGSLDAMIEEAMQTINNPRGLPDDRLCEYIVYELQTKQNIEEPDEYKIYEWIRDFRVKDQPEEYDHTHPDYGKSWGMVPADPDDDEEDEDDGDNEED
jgi:hypothetical protein